MNQNNKRMYVRIEKEGTWGSHSTEGDANFLLEVISEVVTSAIAKGATNDDLNKAVRKGIHVSEITKEYTEGISLL